MVRRAQQVCWGAQSAGMNDEMKSSATQRPDKVKLKVINKYVGRSLYETTTDNAVYCGAERSFEWIVFNIFWTGKLYFMSEGLSTAFNDIILIMNWIVIAASTRSIIN